MAEFCLRCFNELNGTNYKTNEVWLENDFCEGCADWRPCVLELRPKPLLWRLVDLCRLLRKRRSTHQILAGKDDLDARFNQDYDSEDV